MDTSCKDIYCDYYLTPDELRCKDLEAEIERFKSETEGLKKKIVDIGAVVEELSSDIVWSNTADAIIGVEKIKSIVEGEGGN